MAVTERRNQNPLVAAPQLVELFDRTVEPVKSSRSLHGRIEPFIGSSRAVPQPRDSGQISTSYKRCGGRELDDQIRDDGLAPGLT